MKRARIKRKPPKRRDPAEIAAMDQFKASGSHEPCLFSVTRPAHRCRGRLERHHLVTQQFLRREFPGQWDVIWAPAIAVNLCDEAAHQPVTRKQTRVWQHELPVRAIAWAEEKGIGWRLELECPSKPEADPLFLSKVERESVPRYGRSSAMGVTAEEEKIDREHPPESESQFDGDTPVDESDFKPPEDSAGFGEKTQEELDAEDALRRAEDEGMTPPADPDDDDDLPPAADGDDAESAEVGFEIDGEGQLSLTVGGQKPDISIAKLKGKSIAIKGVLKKGDEFDLTVSVRVGEVKFTDKIGPEGEIKETVRSHTLEVTGVDRRDLD